MNPDHPAEDEASSPDAPRPLDPQPARGDDVFVFSLFIAGMSPRSRRAVDNMTKLCDRYLAGRYELQVVDIYQQPELAQGEQLVAAPTLIKKLPSPCAGSSATSRTPIESWCAWTYAPDPSTPRTRMPWVSTRTIPRTSVARSRTSAPGSRRPRRPSARSVAARSMPWLCTNRAATGSTPSRGPTRPTAC